MAAVAPTSQVRREILRVMAPLPFLVSAFKPSSKFGARQCRAGTLFVLNQRSSHIAKISARVSTSGFPASFDAFGPFKRRGYDVTGVLEPRNALRKRKLAYSLHANACMQHAGSQRNRAALRPGFGAGTARWRTARKSLEPDTIRRCLTAKSKRSHRKPTGPSPKTSPALR